jgi:hypothetical protein
MTVNVTDAAGNLLSSKTGVGIASYSLALASAGRYYLTIEGVGSGNVSTTGYSNYGSRGMYQMVATYPSVVPPSPSPSVSKQVQSCYCAC